MLSTSATTTFVTVFDADLNWSDWSTIYSILLFFPLPFVSPARARVGIMIVHAHSLSVVTSLRLSPGKERLSGTSATPRLFLLDAQHTQHQQSRASKQLHDDVSEVDPCTTTMAESGTGIKELMAAETRASQIVAEARIGMYAGQNKKRSARSFDLSLKGSYQRERVSRSLLLCGVHD